MYEYMQEKRVFPRILYPTVIYRRRRKSSLLCVYVFRKHHVEFHVLVVQTREEMYKSVLHVQSCCFA